MTGFGIDGGEDEEEASFGGVGDPEFAAGDEVIAAIGNGASGEGEGVGTGVGFTQSVGANGVFGEGGEASYLLLGAAEVANGVHDQCVLDIDKNSDTGVGGGDFFDGEDRLKERAALPAKLLGDFDGIEA